MDQRPNVTVFTQYFCDLESLRKRWGLFLAMGIIFIILGFLAIGAATVVTKILVIVLGVLLLIGGVLQIGYAIPMKDWSGFFLSLIAGFFYTIVGFMMISNPLISEISLTLLIAAFFLVGGLFRIFSSLVTRFEHWRWAFLSGLINFALGLMIFLGWPQTGLWVIGLFIGIDLLFYGWFWVLLALTARNAPPAIR